ncbi:type II toxin-antitoxin system HicB family antitoxin [Phreatobacter oligotrophus]|uniref:Putative RNase H-like HicB family nuclease n=1 Tax=Phreatobacter oligotrophus TaxID=1122261 RepID=A0A2T4Z069_9HYPH|nr:type II toxin-antitoxin system HicB family antitoxin [Phreatobacter oligotrophus]PTM52880.1 putative RNase H-like HicB family nuclease [Phreatobacter oligotrophus]
MPSYIALVHKDPDSCYGVQFPDVPGVFSAADEIEDLVANAVEALELGAEDWEETHGSPFPLPRTIDQLRDDPDFREAAVDALLLIVPFDPPSRRAAAE